MPRASSLPVHATAGRNLRRVWMLPVCPREHHQLGRLRLPTPPSATTVWRRRLFHRSVRRPIRCHASWAGADWHVSLARNAARTIRRPHRSVSP